MYPLIIIYKGTLLKVFWCELVSIQVVGNRILDPRPAPNQQANRAHK